MEKINKCKTKQSRGKKQKLKKKREIPEKVKVIRYTL